MRKRMVGGFNDVEEAVSVSAATSEAKQEASVMLLFQVLACGRRDRRRERRGFSHCACLLEGRPDTRTRTHTALVYDPTLRLCHGGADPATLRRVRPEYR